MEDKVLFLEPVCTHNIWGGTRLREDFGYPAEGDDIGECWGISAHPNGDDTVREGQYKGQHLSEMWEKHPELFGNLGNRYDRFPLLVKIIDAKDDLSIQVHPDDVYAREHENGSYGKTECWYVLDCPEDATLVIGHHARDKEELTRMIEERRWNDFIREIPVHKGDFIQIDPGTVHAIKGGLLILETQQNSDITYRVYDYDRLSNGKPRELHVKQSIDVIKAPAAPVSECVKETGETEKNKLQKLYGCTYYQVFKLSVDGTCEFSQEFPFLNMTVTEGSGTLDGKAVKKGDHFILLNGYGEVRLQGEMEAIASTTGG
ncbi:MAG: class I mannose-6-phosphate isomerase [Lachnospiraceae bacterium]|nr:class I mannose-6-phosphate isomerase [Lachnospiraceae bacterium]